MKPQALAARLAQSPVAQYLAPLATTTVLLRNAAKTPFFVDVTVSQRAIQKHQPDPAKQNELSFDHPTHKAIETAVRFTRLADAVCREAKTVLVKVQIGDETPRELLLLRPGQVGWQIFDDGGGNVVPGGGTVPLGPGLLVRQLVKFGVGRQLEDISRAVQLGLPLNAKRADKLDRVSLKASSDDLKVTPGMPEVLVRLKFTP